MWYAMWATECRAGESSNKPRRQPGHSGLREGSGWHPDSGQIANDKAHQQYHRHDEDQGPADFPRLEPLLNAHFVFTGGHFDSPPDGLPHISTSASRVSCVDTFTPRGRCVAPEPDGVCSLEITIETHTASLYERSKPDARGTALGSDVPVLS